MERVIAIDRLGEIASLITQVLTIPVPIDFQPDAIVGFAGMGEPWRIRQPIVEWESNVTAKYLIIAGLNSEERCFEGLTIERLIESPYNLRKTSGVIVQTNALHTKDQADWMIDQVGKLQLSSLLFMCSPYHIVRAYLTLLKSYLQTSSQLTQPIAIIPKPIVVSPSTVLPENNAVSRSMITGEIRRIIEYQKKGDVATLVDLENYLDAIIYK